MTPNDNFDLLDLSGKVAKMNADFDIAKEKLTSQIDIMKTSLDQSKALRKQIKLEKDEKKEKDDSKFMDEKNIDLPPNPAEYEDGDHQTFFQDTEVVHFEFTIKDKNFVGLVKNFYPSGAIKRTFYMEDGLLNGLDTYYTLEGMLRMEVMNEKGVIEGITKVYRFGIISTEFEMIGGKIGSWMKTYYETGKIASIIPYKNGKKDGVMEIFNQNGEKIGDTCYKGGMKHGLEMRYYPDGKRQSDTEYVNNVKEGDFNTYYPSGVLMRTEKFSKGVSITYAKIYDQDGKLLDVQ